jgi:hypothetical protein
MQHMTQGVPALVLAANRIYGGSRAPSVDRVLQEMGMTRYADKKLSGDVSMIVAVSNELAVPTKHNLQGSCQLLKERHTRVVVILRGTVSTLAQCSFLLTKGLSGIRCTACVLCSWMHIQPSRWY